MTTDTEACNLASWHSSVSEITGAPIVYSALLTADGLKGSTNLRVRRYPLAHLLHRYHPTT
eukprot:255708-Pyramimonas_sp.AAC.1